MLQTDIEESATAKIAPLFFSYAKSTPEKQAIWCEGETISYRQLSELVCRWSHGMLTNDVKRGDHIGVILPNCIEFVALMLVAADLGAVLVPLNTSLTPNAARRAFDAAEVKHVVSNASLLRALFDPTNAPESTLNWLEIDGLWLSVDTAINHAKQLSHVLDSIPVEVQPNNLALAEDAFILTMTSGSTGDPKPIVLTQRTKFNRASAAIAIYGVTKEDKTLAATPLYHSLAERLVLIPLLTGGTCVLMSKFSATTWLKCVATELVTFTIAVSSQLKLIAEELSVMKKSDANTNQISSLRCIVSSSALLEHSVKADLLEKFDCEFHECYGASEIAIASNLDGVAAKIKLQSVGTAALGVDIKIIDKNGEVLGVGQEGEIVCKTPMLFGGYFKRPDLTSAAMWGDYFKTGDTGKLDEDGFLYFLGRTKDIIISGGINIYPSDIEEVVAQFDTVLESAAFAFADHRLGEVVALAVVPVNKDSFDLRQLRFYCSERLADFQQPRKFFVVDELPRNSMGKLMKFQLVQTLGNKSE
ncbi:class I adenylate-forming enzyme family protein [Undibacterium sp. RTI2.1]|uniref:class I adenylate-forming enzyme family protein n=1 Tax=unclassified Undibacterium TaxID=2630295 RepID=UPI002AB4585D|nr:MULTISPECIES: class I adenylate-forming enzyme family protein [unclassified Undibacterium]MDY7537138.1 class I adenylate-forming enzyme family protein [Undibacterium sp. 5I1]MEB0029823.1 class I adenylate-forming enzyme family protein [Undibacterium sp. RTI2.1]MEB0115108.1 class I adenylate-forming enzyme family protein [Undibacterium sp. RTI2.2]MEB0229316.1 class I adenylate-forming enzyme family protein [Undibacterium sp. 10I3]MEB0256136.1 class I adenylate-forming enzyme family protein [